TREQHIRRERATSNICTAQVLLAVMAGMYGVYHGPKGLEAIAEDVRAKTLALADGLDEIGHAIRHDRFFDTLRVDPSGLDAGELRDRADEAGINLRHYDDGSVGVSLDRATTAEELETLLEVFDPSDAAAPVGPLLDGASPRDIGRLERTSSFMEHENFHEYRSETEMTRYLDRLADHDISLTDSMIPLGSCTMKLNAAAELMPVSWPGFNSAHPFAPTDQNEGFHRLMDQLRDQIHKMTALPAVSLQPNSGAQGEYTGLLAIRAYQRDNGDADRTVCLIPESAHGTNAASAAMAEMDIVGVDCDEDGDVHLDDLRAKAEEQADQLAGAMFTYPSTHGVFESDFEALCEAVHGAGGLVYLDGANMNAQLGLCRPGDYGVDICHLNLHKTFSIPHGGGGPGVGPVAATEELEPYLPDHPLFEVGGGKAPGPVAAAPWGSASILPISWSYIRLMGDDGLRRSAEVAILNANYLADRLGEEYEILYRGEQGRVAHEFILDPREFEETTGVDAQDIAKRLMDYGFHAPTMSWPVHGTLMIEPTESESRDELDWFCDALLSIREEIRAVEAGEYDPEDNPLVNAPHTAAEVTADDWDHPYSRQT
ncbi:MAG: glycine dehydrogenase (aminomethyl-transferring), partial [Bradymonadaceae bacterium]